MIDYNTWYGLNITGTEYYICYLVDLIVVSILTQTYLRFANKEGWEIDSNKLSWIVLIPYYVVLCLKNDKILVKKFKEG